MPITTPLCAMLGIEHPIVCGGMTGLGDAELTAAISETGALGMLTALNNKTPELFREEIRKTRALTSKPFGVNLTILPNMNPPPYEEYAQVCIDEGIKIIETAGNNPARLLKDKNLIQMLKDGGVEVCIHKCIAVRHALSAQKSGVDIISMDGMECGGHPGEDDVGNFVLLAKAAKALSIPFLCSGGVGDGKQLIAALSLGAIGVNMGTRFGVTKENLKWKDNVKEWMINHDEKDTTMVLRPFKNSTRVINNETAKAVNALEQEKGKDLEFGDVMALMAGTRGRQAEVDDDPEAGILTAGQVIGLIDDVPTCQELVDRFVAEAEEVCSGMSNFVSARSRL